MIKLRKSDFGGDIISILTRGMYSDPRDSLREYVQNGVDAGAKNISIKIRQNNIIIEDDGIGMALDVMRRAIRLGVSDKNPKKNVGFMGIGIYSSFHLCNKLIIYSKIDNEKPNKLTFNFKLMRDILDKQKEERFNNKIEDEEVISLQPLLEDSIDLISISEEDFPKVGTTVEMEGIESEFFKSLSRFEEVANYLEQTIPLPFNPRFKWAKIIEERIESICKKHNATFELINLTLQINEESAKLYRPYLDSSFDPEPLKPFFIEIKRANDFFGVAWGCLNSARGTIKNQLRGFLIRKQGFAIGQRDNLLKYFKRQTFFNRYIGEVVIVHPQLLPNAPRTEFEFSPLRIVFDESLRSVANQFNEKANYYQETSKSEQAINDAIDYVKETKAQLNFYSENSDKLAEVLWYLNDHLDSLKKRDNKGYIKEVKQESYNDIVKQIKTVRDEVRSLIDIKRKKKHVTVKSDATIANEVKNIPEKGETTPEPEYNSLIEVIMSMGIDLSDELKIVIQLIDDQYFQTTNNTDEYYLKLKRFKQDIEERLDDD
ncbi:MAG: ATP-binding protein [Nanoarchaeota archaeon]